MTDERDLDDEMQRFGLDDLTADRLLSGRVAPQDAPPGYREVADLVRTAAASGPAADPARETATVAALVETLRSDNHPHQLLRRRSMLAQLLSAKVAAIAAATVLGATAAAAATNSLPDPAQTAVSDAVSHVGLSVPKPNAHASGEHGRPDNPGKAVGPDAAGNAKYGLCTAYAAGPTTTNPHAAGKRSVAFRNLQTAADDAGMSVADYCSDAVPPRHDDSTAPNGTTSTSAPGASNATPPVSGPPFSTPPVSTPVSGPPSSTPPVSTPVSGPPSSTPPVSTPVSGPPSSTPPVSAASNRP